MYLPIFEQAFRDDERVKPEVLLLEVRSPDTRDRHLPGTTWIAVQRRERQTLNPESKELHTAQILIAFQSIEWDMPRGSADHGEFCGYYDADLGRLSLTASGLRPGGVYVPEPLQGLRLGTYLMNEIVTWAQQWPSAIVEPIELSAGDGYIENKGRRNRLYEQFGIQFDYTDPDQKAGWSRSAPVHELRPVDTWKNNITEHSVIESLRRQMVQEKMLSSALEATQKANREISAYQNWASRHPFLAMAKCTWDFHLTKLVTWLIAGSVALATWRLFI
jgi:GNAT superfamily N-acetyltransferase